MFFTISLTSAQAGVTAGLADPLASSPGLRGCDLHGQDGVQVQTGDLRRVPHHLSVEHGQVVRGGGEVGALQRRMVVITIVIVQP